MLPLLERAFPTLLTPNRDIGLQLYGDLAGGRFSYAAGVFNGMFDNGNSDGDTDDHKEFAGRVFVLPFRDSGLEPVEGLGLGLGGSYGEADSTRNALYATTGQRPIFSATLNDNGIRHRIAPQGYYYYGPFGLLGEYTRSSQEVLQGGSHVTLTNAAWQVQTSYVLTGERASYSGVTPASRFEPGSGTLGAFELAARYSELRIDSETFSLLPGPGSNASGAKAWALGLNWYMNRNVRLTFNYEQTDFQRAPDGPVLDKERLFLQRFQLRF
jgi:phosphate-selective porin OprO/OprP